MIESTPVATVAHVPQDSATALVRVLDEYLAALQQGQAPDRAAVLAQHPELASQLDSCLAALDFIHKTGKTNSDTPARLGDFRIQGELGRGGMGVVYEAEQVSLQRRVALKVLRYAGVTDEAALSRFQREAEVVARLHHTNIVPIFAIGCEQGVHYYAMQLIDGEPLDKALAKRKPSYLEIAHWGVQAAEALAHAHARSVIHRDVKPSNLLLDQEGTVWLTDFGLARRAEEVTLTTSGAIVGTPRYMSPEQAAAAGQPVDERSDVYSLGATLYELLTGKPVFTGDSAAIVLAQIQMDDPIPPRQHRSDLPRDLETVLMTCLAKNPADRYQTAQALADDLRRVTLGDPIKARRPPLFERIRRWMNKYGKTAAMMVGSIAVSVALTFGVLWVLAMLERWQHARLFLSTDGPVLTAEVLSASGERMGPRFTVPTEEPHIFPADDYQLRLRGRGFLDEAYALRLDRGRERAFLVGLEHQRLWEPLVVPRCYELFPTAERTDILLLTREGITRVHGGTKATLWTTALEGKIAGLRWDWDTHGTPSGRGSNDRRPVLLTPAPDLDGDGTPDVVFASRRQAAVVALSGVDGHLLWCYQGPPPKLPPDSRFRNESASDGIVLGLLSMDDADKDGVRDLILTCNQQTQADGTTPRWIGALSGRTGKPLWKFDLDGAWFVPPAGTVIPDDSRWENTAGIASGTQGGHRSDMNLLYEKDFVRHGMGMSVPYPAALVNLQGHPVLVVSAGSRLLTLDAKSGKPLGDPHVLDYWPVRPPIFADLNGDGNTDVLLLGPSPNYKPDASKPERPNLPEHVRHLVPEFEPIDANAMSLDDDRLTLQAISLAKKQPLWRETLRGFWGRNWYQEAFDWPQVVTLTKGQAPIVVTPTGDFEGGTKWSGVEARAAATGAVLWRRKLSISTRFGQVLQVNRFIVGPDLDGDGVRDLFCAVLDGREYKPADVDGTIRVLNFDKDYAHPMVRIDALSGADGHGLWWAAIPVRHGSLANSPKPTVRSLRWWMPGADGWPQLLVPYEAGFETSYLVSSRSGKVEHQSGDLPDVRIADLDGDGALDLISFNLDQRNAFDQGGKLVTIRGTMPSTMRRLGGLWKATVDLDGDGIPDLLTRPQTDDEEIASRGGIAGREKDTRDKPLVRAMSGRDGHILWEADINDGKPTASWQESPYKLVKAIHADLDGDGIPDLLATGKNNLFYMSENFAPLVAISGRTGQRIWTIDARVSFWNGPHLLEGRDLDGDGKPEVLYACACDYDWPRGANNSRSTIDWQYWLFVLDSATGKIKWKQPLSERNTSQINSQPASSTFDHAFVDLDGDGLRDLIIEGGLSFKDGGLLAFRGLDGKPLWQWRPAFRKNDGGMSRANRPAFTVGQLDGRLMALVLHNITVKEPNGRETPHAELVALDAKTGEPRWNWRTAVDYQFNERSQNSSVGVTVRPQLVHLAEGKQGICVWTYDYKRRGQVVILNSNGQELARKQVDFRLEDGNRKRQPQQPQTIYNPLYGGDFRVWCHDFYGDGREELVWLTNDALEVWSADLSKLLWKYTLPDRECHLLDIVDHVLVLRSSNQVLGLDGRGQPRWSCAGPGKPLFLMNGERAEDLPRVVFDQGHQVTAILQALPTSDASTMQGFELYQPPVQEDPRFVQPLPWNHLKDRPVLMPATPGFFALALLLRTVVLLLIPGLLLRQAWNRRSPWWVVAALFWLGLMWTFLVFLYLWQLNDDATFQISQNGYGAFVWSVARVTFPLAIYGLPLLAVSRIALTWLAQGRWHYLLALLVFSSLSTVLVGYCWVQKDRASLMPDQTFSQLGWWTIWPAGLYVTGLIVLTGWLLLWVIGRSRRMASRWRPVAAQA